MYVNKKITENREENLHLYEASKRTIQIKKSDADLWSDGEDYKRHEKKMDNVLRSPGEFGPLITS